jgi:hypothetical protein
MELHHSCPEGNIFVDWRWRHMSTISLYAERWRETKRETVAEETARVSNGNTGLEIFAVTNLIIIVDLGPAISSPRTGDS